MMSVLTLPICAYGYAAVLFVAFVQSTGIPFPGAAVVVPIAAYAAATHGLSIAVILALAALGGIGGSLCGFWLGKRHGARLLLLAARRWLGPNLTLPPVSQWLAMTEA